MPKSERIFWLGQGWLLIGVLSGSPIPYLLAVVYTVASYYVNREQSK